MGNKTFLQDEIQIPHSCTFDGHHEEIFIQKGWGKVKFTILYNIPSNNEIIAMNRWAKKRSRIQLGWAFKAALMEIGWQKPRHGFSCRGTITSFRGRFLDPDNLAGGCKILIDAMKDVGLIFRDSPKWWLPEFKQNLDRMNPRTEIEIERIDD